MLNSLPTKHVSALATSVLLLLTTGFRADAATWNWKNQAGSWNWTDGTAWTGDVAPPSADLTTILNFGGNVGTTGTATTYIATNNFAGAFTINQLILNGTDSSGNNSGPSHVLTGGLLSFRGTTPSVMMNGSAKFIVSAPVHLGANLTVGGNGTGTVTFSEGISGFADITKDGSSTMRFGTNPIFPATTAASNNTWMGRLLINGGVVRFNNNAQSASTALRANPVVFTGNGILTASRDPEDQADGFGTSLRLGTLSGTVGAVIAQVLPDVPPAVPARPVSNYDILITALTDGTFGGSITLPAPLDGGNDGGALTIRGTANQTLTGALSIHKDVVIGDGATLTLKSNATLSSQTKGAITFAGGTLVLDNTDVDFVNGRLRVADPGSTTVETIGGGSLTMIGDANGSTELTGRLQLGSFSNATSINKNRSGHLNLNVVHNAGASGQTNLIFQSYSRAEVTIKQLATVNFAATNGAGTALDLGTAGNNPHIRLSNGAFTVLLSGSLISTTEGTASVGWATVDGVSGRRFASYDLVNGVTPVTTVAYGTNLNATDNALLTTSNVSTKATEYVVNSLTLAPSSTGRNLNLQSTGNLSTTAILLTGGIDFLIRSTGGAGIAGANTRFFNVQSAVLTVEPTVASASQPIVKSGQGTLALTHVGNSSLTAITAINQGTLRAAQGTSLPGGEVRLRGGVLELTGGGTFTRTVGLGAGTINWSGVVFDPTANGGLGANISEDDDRGSGGFSAFGSDVTIDLAPAGASLIRWEDLGFIRSSYALIFGTTTATHRVTFADPISLTALTTNPNDFNYNAREIRVIDNPGSTGDWARLTGALSGSTQNDLLKTGNGTLELAATNTYPGATIVDEGTLLVTGSSTASYIHQVKSGATLGGSGSVGPVRIEAGGTIAPGMPIGLASIFRTGDLEFLSPTAALTIGIGGTNAGGEVLNAHDRLIVTGTVTLAGAILNATLLGGYLPAELDTFFILLNDGTDPINGQFAAGSKITIDGKTFDIFYSANFDTQSLTGGNDIALQLIPEPSSALLLALGTLACTRRRRRA